MWRHFHALKHDAERNKLWFVVWHVGQTASWAGLGQWKLPWISDLQLSVWRSGYARLNIRFSPCLVSFLTHTVGTEWHHILVIEHNFGNPDGVWGNSDGGDAQIMIRIPSELHVCPLLNAERHEFICKADPHTNKTVKKAMCVGCVPMTKYYQNRTQWQEQNKGLIKIINISY